MCGILGTIFNGKKKFNKNLFESSLDLLNSRGPDFSKIDEGNDYIFGHKRLSIIDLSQNSNQPMYSNCKRYICLFNGEIYNFQKLKKNLLEKKYNFRSSGDTEVLLNGWIEWGVEIFDKLDGMYSFAIWDQQLKKLIIARDRIGEKPLYYLKDENSFSFSSRPKSLLRLYPDYKTKFDPQSLRFFIENGYVPSPYTIHQKMFKLEPGSYLILDKKFQINKKNYYNFKKKKNNKILLNESSAINQLDILLGRSVENRMISDVPLGSFLSGGVDSSLITSYMARYKSDKINTFSITFEDKSQDESEHALLVSKHLKTNHNVINFKSNKILDLLEIYEDNFDEPFYDTSAFPVLAISEFTKNNVSVVLTGDGADELFGGYFIYLLHRYSKYNNLIPNFLINLIKQINNHKIKLFANTIGISSSSLFFYLRSITKDFKNPLNEIFLSNTFSSEKFFKENIWNNYNEFSSTEKCMLQDIKYNLADNYLQKIDMGTMSYSLEARSPYLSEDLVNWSLNIPLKFKINNFKGKYLLKKLASNYLPNNIIYRKKMGFEVPMENWLRYELKDWMIDLFEYGKKYSELPIDFNIVDKLLELHLKKIRNVFPILWALLMLINYEKKMNIN